jgi:hypothetical protein
MSDATADYATTNVRLSAEHSGAIGEQERHLPPRPVISALRWLDAPMCTSVHETFP